MPDPVAVDIELAKSLVGGPWVSSDLYMRRLSCMCSLILEVESLRARLNEVADQILEIDSYDIPENIVMSFDRLAESIRQNRELNRGGFTHELKTWPNPFEACWTRRKTAEFRMNDRDFREGQMMLLREWEPESERYTGREIRAMITDVRYGGRFGIPQGFVMLSFATLENRTVAT